MAKKRLLFLILFVSVFFLSLVLSETSVNVPSSVGVDLGLQVLRDSFDGSTTDFLSLNDSVLNNLSGMALEDSRYGKIVFDEVVNLSEGLSGNVVDIDGNVDISANFFEIGGLESLAGKDMILYVYGSLTFNEPRVMRNGEVCAAAVCTSLQSVGSIWIIHVNGFGEYSIEGVVVDDSGGDSGDGGGGGQTFYDDNDSSEDSGSGDSDDEVSDEDSGSDKETPYSGNPGFSIDKVLFNVVLFQGKEFSDEIVVSNDGDVALNVSVTSATSIGDLVSIEPESFRLPAGETKNVRFEFKVANDTAPDVYVGRITFSDGKGSRVANVLIEVKSKEALFDIKTRGKSVYIEPGEELLSDIDILNVGNVSGVDIKLYYDIRDYDEKIYVFNEEVIMIDDELNLERSLMVPENINPGEYVFYVKVSYNEVVAASAYTFNTRKRVLFFLRLKFWAYTLLVILGLFIIWLLIRLLHSMGFVGDLEKKVQKNDKNIFK